MSEVGMEHLLASALGREGLEALLGDPRDPDFDTVAHLAAEDTLRSALACLEPVSGGGQGERDG